MVADYTGVMLPVTAIIPAYNRASLCLMAVKSVFEQTQKPSQIIVIDDGSEDSLDEVRKFLVKIGGLYLRQDNKGVSAARNFGVSHATQEWVAFLDSDDQWLPTKLERQFELHQTDRTLAISQTAELWTYNGVHRNQRKRHAPAQGQCFERCLEMCCISASAAIISKKVFDDAGGFDESLPVCEDYDLWIRLSRRYPVGLISEPLVLKTRSDEGQLSQSVEALDAYRVKALVKLMESNLTQAERLLTSNALCKKLSILINGARKRGLQHQLEYYLDIQAQLA